MSQFSVAVGDQDPEIIAGINVSEHTESFRSFKEEKDQEIENLTELFGSIHDLANLKHQFYQVRQKLVSKKFELQDVSNVVSRNYKQMKRDIAKSYIMGQRRVQNTAITLKNNDDRETFYDADLRAVIWFIDALDNQINWVADSLKTVDNLIYGVPYAIELESKYKTSI